MGVLTPISMLVWMWWVVDMEALAQLLPQTIKFYTLIGGVCLSAAFAAWTIYFMIKSRTHCASCGADRSCRSWS